MKRKHPEKSQWSPLQEAFELGIAYKLRAWGKRWEGLLRTGRQRATSSSLAHVLGRRSLMRCSRKETQPAEQEMLRDETCGVSWGHWMRSLLLTLRQLAWKETLKCIDSSAVSWRVDWRQGMMEVEGSQRKLFPSSQVLKVQVWHYVQRHWCEGSTSWLSPRA